MAATKDMYYVPDSLRREFSVHEMAEFLEQFKEFDTSGDGGVDANELSTLMESMNIHMEKAELLSLIAIVDENGSGQIEFNEFVLMMSNLRRGKSNKLSKFVQMSKQAFQIRQEFHALDDNPVKGCRVVPFKQDMRQWTVFLQGPADTPYDGGVFRFHFQFGHDYPYEPPIVSLQTRIYHVNFIMLLDGTAPTEWLASMWTPGTTALKPFIHRHTISL
ncbi:hypothetical protein, variant 6 [Aphanomyces astaci]|uniref:Uncharacterized protein n=1 Tax=Aphanomyces astaci TaxID=112090 RepID=W4G3F6_APHAT|nr:hypothetical protein, variant 6 [Aphanomyces astaci]ETV74242.1 hypothetical protein, variant 6 [Aphanomyces astaci]|eukprot:XP_009836343.1 hypothetical protein, variant 6 [Aphanomyces astaci]